MAKTDFWAKKEIVENRKRQQAVFFFQNVIRHRLSGEASWIEKEAY